MFDAWAQDTWSEVRERLGLAAFLAEPLSTPQGTVGGLFAGWSAPVGSFLEEERHAIGVVAGTAGARLAHFASQAGTDSSLRERLAELQALTQLAQRITGLADRDAVLDELLVAFREVASVDGAAWCVRSDGELIVRRTLALDASDAAALTAGLREWASERGATRLAAEPGRELLVLPVLPTGEAVLAGLGVGVRAPEGDPVLATLARYGAVALENVRLHTRERRTISRLQRANLDSGEESRRLERILSLHRELTRALLESRGLESVAASLAEVMNAEVLIVGQHDEELARVPAGTDLEWQSPAAGEARPRTIVETNDGRTTIASPAAAESEVLAWVTVRFTDDAGPVEQAAVEHGAVLAALDLLRDRTALEVEARLRRGLIEELFGGEFVDELVVRRGLALGFDPLQPARVFVVEAAADDLPAPELQRLHGTVRACARDSGREHLVALDGGTVVALVHDNADQPFEDELRRSVERQLPGVAVNIGAGTGCAKLADYRLSHISARRGVDLMRLVGRAGDTLSFRHAGVEQMLLRSSEPEALVEFIERYVEPLDRYDAAHTSELRRTLEAYYDAGGRLEPAARELHVHVSTLRYRLGRVRAVLGVDPREGDSRLDLEVALRAARTLPVHRGR